MKKIAIYFTCICFALTGIGCKKDGNGGGGKPVFAPILSFGFCVEDNTNFGDIEDPEDDKTDFDKDYVVENPETNFSLSIPAIASKAALKARFTLLDNVILTVENGYENIAPETGEGEEPLPPVYQIVIDTLISKEFPLNYSYPVDITATDTITGQVRLYVLTVSNLPQPMVFTKVAEYYESDFTSAEDMAMAVHPTTGEPYILYQRAYKENDETIYSGSMVKWNGTAFSTVGSKNFTAGRLRYSSMQFIADGTPYVGYLDGASSNKPTIMKYSGNSWSVVGAAGFAEAGNTSAGMGFLVYGTDNKIIEAHQQNTAGAQPRRQINISYYSGGSWSSNNTISLIEPVSGTTNAVYNPRFVASENDVYAAIAVNGVGNMVYKYDGSAWTSLGLAHGTTINTSDLDMAMDGAGGIYVVAIEANSTKDVMVMKYSASAGTWNQVGGNIPRHKNANTFAIAFDKADNPYILYTDYNASNTYTVNIVSLDRQTFKWTEPTVLESNAGGNRNLQLVVNKDDVMYAAFSTQIPKNDMTGTPAYYKYNLYEIEK